MKLCIAEAIKAAHDKLNSNFKCRCDKKNSIKVVSDLLIDDQLTAGLDVGVGDIGCLIAAVVYAARVDDLDVSDVRDLRVTISGVIY